MQKDPKHATILRMSSTSTTSLILNGEIKIRWVDGAGDSPATTTPSHYGLKDQRQALTK
jgi:hypothetical protein